MKITIKDVAIEAKVAPSTVSRVINGKDQLAPETKEKVMRAIEKLDYRPNAIARSLVNKKRNMLGVVMPSEAQDFLSHQFFLEAMKGMSNFAQEKKYYITYAFSKNEMSEEKYVKELCESSMVDGIFLLRAKEEDKIIEYLKKIDFPFVVIGRPENTEDILWVDNDNFKASYTISEKIINKGAKKISFLGARPHWNVTKDRFNGFKIACQINGISICEDLIFYGNDFSENIGYELTEKLLRKEKDIQAIITTDDLLAIGVLKKLKEENLNNIIVTGFNNIPLAPYQDPPLASVDIRAVDLGYMATELLINKLEGIENINNHKIIDCKLIERASMNFNIKK